MATDDDKGCSVLELNDAECFGQPYFDPVEEIVFDEKLYKSVCERYYMKRYKFDAKSGEHICILEHSNRICLVTLAPNHPIIRDGKKVESVDFKINDGLDRATNKVSGRMKRGAQWLNTTAILCNLKCTDGSSYRIVPGLKANLIEINELLSTNPNLVVEQPTSSGYIAILLTRHEDHSKEMNKLTSEDEFWLKVGMKCNKIDNNEGDHLDKDSVPKL